MYVREAVGMETGIRFWGPRASEGYARQLHGKDMKKHDVDNAVETIKLPNRHDLEALRVFGDSKKEVGNLECHFSFTSNRACEALNFIDSGLSTLFNTSFYRQPIYTVAQSLIRREISSPSFHRI